MPRLFIFDLDGTLVHFPHEFLFLEAERILAKLEHPPVERHRLKEHFSDFDFFRFVTHPEPEQFVEMFWSVFDWENYPRSLPLDGVVNALEQLKADGAKTAIATARLSTEEKVREDLIPTGILTHIEEIVPRRSAETHWTDKTGHIAELCEKFSVHPRDTVMIGDIPADIETARAAGIVRTVAVLSGGIKAEVLRRSSPTLLLNSVSELPQALAKLKV